VEKQAVVLLLSVMFGTGAGLLYDILRPLRHRLSRGWELFADALFCVGCGIAVFCFAMGSGGRLSTWELAGMLLGFTAYLHILSRWSLPLIERFFQIFENAMLLCKKILAKLKNSAKRVFQKMRE